MIYTIRCNRLVTYDEIWSITYNGFSQRIEECIYIARDAEECKFPILILEEMKVFMYGEFTQMR